MRIAYHEAPHYVVFSMPLLPSPFLGPDVFLNTQFSNSVGLRSSLIVRDQLSCPYKTTTELYFSIS